MIKCVVFDFGGVIVRTMDYSGRRKWERRLGLADFESEKVVFGSEESRKGEVGLLTEDEVWAAAARRLGLNDEDLAAMRLDYWSGDRMDDELLAAIEQLRARYKTALLSNAWNSLRALLDGDQRFAKVLGAFDVVMISAEEGVRKPDAALFQRLLERVGVQPEEAVFVDDMLANVEGARAVGMHAIQFKSTPETLRALEDLGVELTADR